MMEVLLNAPVISMNALSTHVESLAAKQGNVFDFRRQVPPMDKKGISCALVWLSERFHETLCMTAWFSAIYTVD